MLQLPNVYKPAIFGDEIVLRSIDWLENFPWRQDNTTTNSKDKYEIYLSVKDFAPEEISVKTSESDGFLVIEGKHDEKQDECGFISRHFVRKYKLPDGCKMESVKSRLTPDGVLVISILREVVKKQDIVIPVSHVGTKNKCKL